jgi:hypothetical protein
MHNRNSRTMRAIFTCSAAVLMVVSAGSPVAAHDQGRWDANDANGYLDLHAVYTAHGHGTGNWSKSNRLWFCTSMENAWYPYMLHHGNYIEFDLDVRNGRQPEYGVFFKGHNGSLRGVLWSFNHDREVTTFPGYRYGHHKGGCVYVERHFLKPIQQGLMRWQVFTYYHSRRICRYGCVDSTKIFSHFNV